MKNNRILTVILLCCVALLGEEAPSSRRLTPTVQAVAKALPWVVNIGTQTLVKVNDGYDDSFEEFYFLRFRRMKQKIVQEYSPLGSGIVVDSRGFVLTNLHVVKRAKNIEIRLWNGQKAQGELIGYDAPNDLCLIRMIGLTLPENFQAANLGRPDDIMLGESVITIGNPFGLEHSVSQGLLSALNRSYEDDSYPFNDILQTDAAINPGNSGGPLINLDGDLIGMNQAIRRNAAGIGFAIPVKRIEQFLSHWLMPFRFSNATLGISTRSSLETGPRGVILTELVPNGPAEKAGLKSGDEIIAVNQTPVRRLIDFGRAVCLLKNGDSVRLTRADGNVFIVTAEPMTPSELLQTRLGMQLQTLTPALCQAMEIPQEIKGMVISEMMEEVPFVTQNEKWREIVKRGDLVLQVNNQTIESPAQLAFMLSKTRSGQPVTMRVLSFQNSRHDLIQLDITLFLY